MYWGDAKLSRLEKSRVDGSERQVIYSNLGDRYFGIALSSRYLYVTDWTERQDICSCLIDKSSVI